ncbi:hypothetical protein LDENG_00280690 [Lucifuga dentata]|nr:hypothetical protein LDENG_00280690 [Lucifuga dentata]
MAACWSLHFLPSSVFIQVLVMQTSWRWRDASSSGSPSLLCYHKILLLSYFCWVRLCPFAFESHNESIHLL